MARTAWTAQKIVDASMSWRSSWHPAGSVHGLVDGYEFSHLGDELTLLNYRGLSSDPWRILDNTLELARERGATAIRFTVGPGVFGDVTHRDIEARGGEVVGIVDILALPITEESIAAIPAADGIALREVCDRADLDRFVAVSEEVFAYPPPIIDDEHGPRLAGAESDHSAMFLALDGTPSDAGEVGVETVGTMVRGAAGYMLVGPVARMFGAAVREGSRGRGIYRSLIRVRMSDALCHGGTLALVHAERMSSPILQRIGFEHFGCRSLTRIPVNGA